MMRTNIAKRIATLMTLLSVSTLSILSFPLTAFSEELPSSIGCNDVNKEIIPTNAEDGTYFGDIDWYDTQVEAWLHARFKFGDYAELKTVWLPFHGWCTHRCMITDVATYCEDGKWTPSYKNDYNNCFHAGDRYQ